jgi:hypothetical protein
MEGARQGTEEMKCHGEQKRKKEQHQKTEKKNTRML